MEYWMKHGEADTKRQALEKLAEVSFCSYFLTSLLVVASCGRQRKFASGNNRLSRKLLRLRWRPTTLRFRLLQRWPVSNRQGMLTRRCELMLVLLLLLHLAGIRMSPPAPDWLLALPLVVAGCNFCFSVEVEY